MKKQKILIPFLVLGAGIVSASCGGPGKADNRTVVTFWSTIGKTNAAQFLDPMIKQFEKLHPDIKIKHTPQGGYDDLKNAISNNIGNGELPTMAYCYPDHVADYLYAKAVLKLDDYIFNEEYGIGKEEGEESFDDFIGSYLDEGRAYAEEGYYSLPFQKSTEVLFYNKTVFDEKGWEVPATWDEVWALCKTMKEDPDYGEKTPLGYDSSANWMITYAAEAGIPYTTASGEEHFLFDNPQMKALFSQLKGYYDKGYFTTQDILGNFTSGKFTQQEILMTVGSSAGTAKQYADSFEVGIAAVPQYDLNDGKVITQGPSICFFNRATEKETLAGWEFYKYATNSLNGAIFSGKTGYMPVRQSSYSAAPIVETKSQTSGSDGLIAQLYKFIEDEENNYAKWYYSSPVFRGSSVARIQIGKAITAHLTGSKTVDEALSDAMSTCIFAVE